MICNAKKMLNIRNNGKFVIARSEATKQSINEIELGFQIFVARKTFVVDCHVGFQPPRNDPFFLLILTALI
jgi:hypothetical protein